MADFELIVNFQSFEFSFSFKKFLIFFEIFHTFSNKRIIYLSARFPVETCQIWSFEQNKTNQFDHLRLT